jgi:hypothetical protein
MQVGVLRDQGVSEGIDGRPCDRERFPVDLDMGRERLDRRPGCRLRSEEGWRRPLDPTRQEPLLEFDPISVEAFASPTCETDDATGTHDPGHLFEGRPGGRFVEVVAERVEDVIEAPVREREPLPAG